MSEGQDSISSGDKSLKNFPKKVRNHLSKRYTQAGVILEYGPSETTMLAAQQPGKFIQCVESDPDWAMELRSDLDQMKTRSPVIIHAADIGPVGPWGRPLAPTQWAKFHHYPVEVWDQPFFQHPDLVLINGRFRSACFATVCLRITQPVRLLFDNYFDRPQYHDVEALAKPTKRIDRMAEFKLEPRSFSPEEFTRLLPFFAQASYA